MPSNVGPAFTSNATELTAKLNNAAGRIEDPRALLERIREILSRQETDVFASEGAALGETWAAIVQPERKIGSQTLVYSGALLASVADGGRITGTTLRVHPKPFYARWHQFGTSKMAARPFTGISDATSRLILQEFQRAADQDLGV
jgi:phage gpG-like protein